MRRLLASGAVAAALVAVTAATAAVGSPAVSSRVHRSDAGPARATPSVQIMVVGRRRTLLATRTVRLRGRTITAGRRHCSVPAGTPLVGLVASGLPIQVTDAAGCDPAALFVTRVGSERNHGFAGWEYKVGAASSSFGAGDPGGRLRPGSQLVWFWCVRATACQRTLAIRGPATAPAGGSAFTVTVLGYDDNGHAARVSGATVRLGSEVATSGAGGLSILAAPVQAGTYAVSVSKPGLVPAFPIRLVVR